MFLSLGILFSYIIGSYFDWRTSCYIMMVPPLVLFFFLHLCPETPYWYILQNQDDKAFETLKKLWFKDDDFLMSEIKHMKQKLDQVGTDISYLELFKRRSLMPLLVSLFVQLCQQICGGNILMMYTSQIYSDLDLKSERSIDVKLATVFTGIAQVIGTMVSLFFIDKFGRKTLLCFSMISFGVFFFLFAGYHYALLNGYSVPAELAVAFIFLAILSYCLGLRSVPWILPSELFNTGIRSRANSISQLFNRFGNLILVQVNC